ncbi:hypothetical protein [Ruthenibacterium lactatiformans]|uniref:SCP domain-containing protein n=1 Tax=Ruthenibacterium lactatiformans TaxID=1550024 RepID=A0A6I3QPE9_9FIRM|nr:hypothetical protein [Ruthenibacterium lactatiformans]MTQ80585.1 hypothetical protein [Ruthenibacterium lactatiformans]MTS16031.1 hypothetical protein [Ruthenibacterium lactatiformans]MTS19769.1 hypothetical protein [Ruthenibacterium lactatiformans]MTS27762.1 hypothetical protein [Ruthenibacterium lactatiformans]MTS31856.1 hypothetical protein [Ruthenibacterium lactatiformans]
MKTIVSLALAGLMSISALLPALAAQEAESVSIHESSGISESMAQNESSVSSSDSLADGSASSSSNSTEDERTEPEPGSNAEDESDSVPQPESSSTPVEYDSSISEDSETETGSSLPVSESAVPDETESATGSETAVDEQSVPVTVSEEYALLLATNQADSMMGHAGMERSDACTQPAASFALSDYAAETEDESYCLLWEAMNAAFEQLGAQGCTAANCVFTDGMIILMR